MSNSSQASVGAPLYNPNRSHHAQYSQLLTYRDGDGVQHSIATLAGWEKRRAAILKRMQAVMGPLPDGSRRVPLAIETVKEEILPLFTRRKITFAVERNDRSPAYLLIPHKIRAGAPAMSYAVSVLA